MLRKPESDEIWLFHHKALHYCCFFTTLALNIWWNKLPIFYLANFDLSNGSNAIFPATFLSLFHLYKCWQLKKIISLSRTSFVVSVTVEWESSLEHPFPFPFPGIPGTKSFPFPGNENSNSREILHYKITQIYPFLDFFEADFPCPK